MSFAELANENFSRALAQISVTEPTEIQQRAIPLILSGTDVIASSPTGTGKTLAYLLPVFMSIDSAVKTPQAIIITPTHELAAQVFKHSKVLADASGVTVTLIIGGASLPRQLERLKEKPKIIIGSAGRILELIKLKKLSAHTVKTIVLDEADRLLDDHNIEASTALIKTTQRDRQLLFFSASMPAAAQQRAKALAKDPEILATASGLSMPDNIEHICFVCDPRDKIEYLRKIVHSASVTRGIVFLNNPDSIENLVKRLNYHGIRAVQLFGQALKAERKQALSDFSEGRAEILVASDIACRGLDISGVTHIIHFDVPEDPVFYLHRAGRTGRMDKRGVSIVIAAAAELKSLRLCEKRLNFTSVQKEMRFGQISDANNTKKIAKKSEK